MHHHAVAAETQLSSEVRVITAEFCSRSLVCVCVCVCVCSFLSTCSVYSIYGTTQAPRPSFLSAVGRGFVCGYVGTCTDVRSYSFCRSDRVERRTTYNDVSFSATQLRGPLGSLQTARTEETPDHQRLHHPDQVIGRWRERQGTPVHSQGYRCDQGA